MHTVLTALAITFFALCLIGATCWCLHRAVASVPARIWVLITRVIPWMHTDPWPGWHQTRDPGWVNEISAPMPAITEEAVPAPTGNGVTHGDDWAQRMTAPAPAIVASPTHPGRALEWVKQWDGEQA